MASTDLLDAFAAYITPDVTRRAATTLGESEEGITRALGAAAPTMLAMLQQKSGDGGFMRQVMALLSDSANDPSVTTNPAKLLGNDPSASSITQLGGRFLSTLFGGQQSSVASALASYAGIKPNSASSLLNLAAPMLMGLLGKQMRTSGQDSGWLASLLSSQRGRIMSAVPGAIASLLGFGGWSPSAATTTTTTARTAPSAATGTRWIWPLLISLLALGGLWALLRDRRVPEETARVAQPVPGVAQRAPQPLPGQQVGQAARQAGDQAVAVGQGAADYAQLAAANLGSYLSRKLPSNVELNIPERGVESQVLTFIEASQPIDPPTWFNFDRITFDTGSARLQPKSKEQLRNIAEILKAYPAVNVKIGGYTDNTGDPAANMKLSQERAQAVMDEIVVVGIAPERVSAEGFGQQHPVADNATEVGRAQNRRIAMRVTQR